METIDGRVKRKISGQRFHIAGSAGTSLPQATLLYAHSLVAKVTYALVSKGGRIVIQLGEEPIAEGTGFSKLFDWTVLEQVVNVASEGKLPSESIQGSPCIGVGFSDWRTRMPSSRTQLVKEAVNRGLLEVVQLPELLHIGGVLRERQAFYGDVLVNLGWSWCGTLAELYRRDAPACHPFGPPSNSRETKSFRAFEFGSNGKAEQLL